MGFACFSFVSIVHFDHDTGEPCTAVSDYPLLHFLLSSGGLSDFL